MKDRAFIDTNVLIYLFSNDDEIKLKKAGKALEGCLPIISTQVVREFANAKLRKQADALEIMDEINSIISKIEVINEKIEHIQKAIYIKERYKFSFYDSLIIASALSADCSVLYSEDMQDGQIIDERLKVINPFL